MRCMNLAGVAHAVTPNIARTAALLLLLLLVVLLLEGPLQRRCRHSRVHASAQAHQLHARLGPAGRAAA